MTVQSSHCAAPMSHTARASRRSLLARLIDMLLLRRQRAQLAKLDDAALRDMGLTRAQALQEAKRHMWDAPEFWRG